MAELSVGFAEFVVLPNANEDGAEVFPNALEVVLEPKLKLENGDAFAAGAGGTTAGVGA